MFVCCLTVTSITLQVKIRYIEVDDHFRMRVDKLVEQIARDRDNGLIPFFVGCTSGECR
jgi:glutamate/tyrosine decarboxylase-like PLP-dependent enzyme